MTQINRYAEVFTWTFGRSTASAALSNATASTTTEDLRNDQGGIFVGRVFTAALIHSGVATVNGNTTGAELPRESVAPGSNVTPNYAHITAQAVLRDGVLWPRKGAAALSILFGSGQRPVITDAPILIGPNAQTRWNLATVTTIPANYSISGQLAVSGIIVLPGDSEFESLLARLG